MLKVRLPEFLTPRRKYEVNESMWFVKFGRPKIKVIKRVGIPLGLRLASDGQRTGLLAIRWVRVGASGLAGQGHKVVLLVQWRRMPKDWEVSIVNKMKLMESKGIPFPEVLHIFLPSIMGEAPADVLLKWVGRRIRQQPKSFTNAVAKMFGKSARPIISGLENIADLDMMLQSHLPVEPPYQSLVEAIRAADGESGWGKSSDYCLGPRSKSIDSLIVQLPVRTNRTGTPLGNGKKPFIKSEQPPFR